MYTYTVHTNVHVYIVGSNEDVSQQSAVHSSDDRRRGITTSPSCEDEIKSRADRIREQGHQLQDIKIQVHASTTHNTFNLIKTFILCVLRQLISVRSLTCTCTKCVVLCAACVMCVLSDMYNVFVCVTCAV